MSNELPNGLADNTSPFGISIFSPYWLTHNATDKLTFRVTNNISTIRIPNSESHGIAEQFPIIVPIYIPNIVYFGSNPWPNQ
jgi:hypothetical protein